MIGLVDYDLQTTSSQSLLVPNLQIMKLATYYRMEENTFCRLIPLDDTNLDNYDKIYFFSETSRNPIVPPAFLRANNVEFGGSAFTNGKYKPFNNEIIDYTIARPTIYKDFLKEKYKSGIKTKVIEHVLDDSYYRMFVNGKLMPIPPIYPRKRLFLYDTDFFYDQWSETLQKIADRHPTSIVPIHPVFCRNLRNFFTLRKIPKFSRQYPIILDLDIPYDEIYYMLKKYKNAFLADVTPSSHVALPIGGTFPTDFQYYKDIIYKLNLLYSFWSKQIKIKIKYFYPQNNYNNPLEDLELMIEQWTTGKTADSKTLGERISSRLPKDKIEILKQQKKLLLKFYPSAKPLFDQNYSLLSERGSWRL